MSTYYLVARNRNDNTFQIIDLKETWYLGKEKGREDVFTRSNDLEAIDLVTTRFASEKQMAERMTSHGYISDSDVDIFIALDQKVEDKHYVKFQEVIYTPENNKRSLDLRKVAIGSMGNGFNNDQNILNPIYDELIANAYMLNDFYSMIVDGKMNFAYGFIEKIKEIRACSRIPGRAKDMIRGKVDNYVSFRNIVEALNRLDRLGVYSQDDRVKNNLDFIDENLSQRLALLPEFVTRIDENASSKQRVTPSPLCSNCFKVQEATKKLIEEENEADKIKIPRSNVTDEEKRETIYKILKTLPRKTFYKDKETDRVLFNDLVFKYTQPTEKEMKKLETYLTGNLSRYIGDYINDYAILTDSIKSGVTSSYEVSELQHEVEFDMRKIDKRLQSARCLNMVYEWCVVYDGALRRDAAYSPVGEDNKAKSYGKK